MGYIIGFDPSPIGLRNMTRGRHKWPACVVNSGKCSWVRATAASIAACPGRDHQHGQEHRRPQLKIFTRLTSIPMCAWTTWVSRNNLCFMKYIVSIPIVSADWVFVLQFPTPWNVPRTSDMILTTRIFELYTWICGHPSQESTIDLNLSTRKGLEKRKLTGKKVATKEKDQLSCWRCPFLKASEREIEQERQLTRKSRSKMVNIEGLAVGWRQLFFKFV